MIAKSTWKILGPQGLPLPSDCYEIKSTGENDSIDFDLLFSKEVEVSQVVLEVTFQEPIVEWRYLDYTWRQVSKSAWVAPVHSPKVLRLNNGYLVVAQKNKGCWQYKPQSGTLLWYFIHPNLAPTLVYDSLDRRVFLQSQEIARGTSIQTGLIWTRGTIEEWARTPEGFVPTICFTDHSDFDTLQNLRVQRDFFSSLGIKVTKGFFLYDYTHKDENASFEDQESKIELIQWKEDGHELAYHALSQSYRGEISDEEFQSFECPHEIAPVNTYIDHGFHPYNYTQQQLGNWEDWYKHMQSKGIERLWTYVDAGEAHYFNLNQLNPEGYTLKKMEQSAKLARKKGKARSKLTDFRNFLMYGVPESVLREGKFFGAALLGLSSKINLSNLKKGGISGFRFLGEIVKPSNLSETIFRIRHIFPVNQFSPLFFFSPNQKSTQFKSFQTLAVRDFDIAFSEEAIDTLLRENGALIAHTYFAYLGVNHPGRLFEDRSWTIRKDAREGFERLSKLIKERKIWNPTLREMEEFHRQFEGIEYSKKGDNLIVNNFNGITRIIE